MCQQGASYGLRCPKIFQLSKSARRAITASRVMKSISSPCSLQCYLDLLMWTVNDSPLHAEF